jgi:tungstate transport system ATP-binding protein
MVSLAASWNGETATTDEVRLTLEEVCFEVGGKKLINHLSLTLEGGPPTVVMGPNGAGKSLLLRLCHGLLRPTSGRIVWNVGASSDIRRAQAMVFQRPIMLRRSVAANVDYALRVSGLLTALAGRSARVLSGGEQQRLALARAWALQPQVLFLDEPAANLDPAATRACEDMIHIIDTAGTKIVMTTHDLGQARRLASEVLFLHKGRLTEQTAACVFFEQPRSEPAAAFLKGELFL